METNTAHENTKMSDRDLEFILSLAEEVRANMIPESNTWIYEIIVEKIHETSGKENKPQGVLNKIISDYQTERQYNESLIAMWPKKARIGKEAKRTENLVLNFKIEFIEIMIDLCSSDLELINSILNVDLYKKGFLNLESIQTLRSKGIKPRNILEYIKKEPHTNHVIALFHHLGFLEYLLKQYHFVDHLGVSKEIQSWFIKKGSYDQVRRAVKHFMLKEKYNDDFDPPIKVIRKLFPL